jgi:hypothetical protein
MPEAAEILTEALGRPIAFAQTPIEQSNRFRQYSEDMALMLQWFERGGYGVDITGLEGEFARAHEAPRLGAPLSLRVLIRNRSCLEKVGPQLQGVRFDPVTGEGRDAFIEQRPKRLSVSHSARCPNSIRRSSVKPSAWSTR